MTVEIIHLGVMLLGGVLGWFLKNPQQPNSPSSLMQLLLKLFQELQQQKQSQEQSQQLLALFGQLQPPAKPAEVKP